MSWVTTYTDAPGATTASTCDHWGRAKMGVAVLAFVRGGPPGYVAGIYHAVTGGLKFGRGFGQLVTGLTFPCRDCSAKKQFESFVRGVLPSNKSLWDFVGGLP